MLRFLSRVLLLQIKVSPQVLTWLLLHVLAALALCGYIRWRRTRERKFWRAPATTVWLGPLDFETQPDARGVAPVHSHL